MSARTWAIVATVVGGGLLVKFVADREAAEAFANDGGLTSAAVVPLDVEPAVVNETLLNVPQWVRDALAGSTVDDETVPNPSTVGPAYARAPGFVQAVIRDHFERSTWDAMAAIAECESSFIPTAHNTNGEDSRGLWQVNIGPGANTDFRTWNLFDPAVNARAARIILDRQGYRAWYHCARRAGLIA